MLDRLVPLNAAVSPLSNATRVSAASVERVGARSVVTRVISHSPLRVLTPENHGDAAWLFLSSLGGGFVGRDCLSLAVEVGEGATCWLSSQASSKAYKKSDSTFELSANVASKGSLLVWPDTVTCFAGASLKQTQRLTAASDASAIWVDVISAGRVSQGERWAFDFFSTRLMFDVDGKAWLREASLFRPEHGSLEARMAGLEALATVVVLGPRHERLVAELSASIAARPARESVLVAASPRDGGLVMRAAGPSLERLVDALRGLLRPAVVAELGDDPFARKW